MDKYIEERGESEVQKMASDLQAGEITYLEIESILTGQGWLMSEIEAYFSKFEA